MISHFAFKSWKPPHLSSEQLGTIVQNVKENSIDLYVDRFAHLPTARAFSSGRTWQEIWAYWSPAFFYLVAGLIGLALGLYADSTRARALEPIAAVLLIAGLIGLPVFLASVWFTARKYRAWLSHLVELVKN